jgi:hypothetical protein
MELYQFWTLVGMLTAGFGWLIHQINGVKDRMAKLETRITVIETILGMIGIKFNKTGTDD